MSKRFRLWTLRLVPFFLIALMGSDCDFDGDSGGVIGLIAAIVQLVVSIIDIAD